MRKILFIVAPENFRDEELFNPMEILKKENRIYIASQGVKIATGLKNGVVPVDLDIKDVKMAKFDAVIFVGGGGAKIYFDDKTAHKIARDAFEQGKIVAAICIAPSILANAGLLHAMKVTSFPSEEENLKERGAAFLHEDVVVDDNLITASGPIAAKRFGEAIKKALEKNLETV